MSAIRESPGVQPKRWTKEEYYRLGELGFFQRQHVELIEGQLMVASPQNPLHASAVSLAGYTLRAHFGTGYEVRGQLPIDLGQTTEPEPALAVVVGFPGQFRTAHPTTAELIVEVSDSTLAFDRSRKGSLYARAGIADYWIVNVVDRQIEVYRDPGPDPTQPNGHRYASQTVVVPPGSIAPLARPQALISVADLLP